MLKTNSWKFDLLMGIKRAVPVLGLFIILLASTLTVNPAFAVPSDGTVDSFQKISLNEGGFDGLIVPEDQFGFSETNIGDLDGDGVQDLAVGVPNDAGGDRQQGAVWILFMNSNGTVKSEQKISKIEGGFDGAVDNFDFFGTSVAGIGDLDNDGNPDLAVGAIFDDDGGGPFGDTGAVYLLFLNSNGTVKSHQKISDNSPNLNGILPDRSNFGRSVTSLGDLDGDGVLDLAVGANGDEDGGQNRGAVWIIFLNSNGSVKDKQKISDLEGNFNGVLTGINTGFGVSVTNLDDLDGDTIPDLAVGAIRDDDSGSVWILFLNADGTVKSEQKISNNAGGMSQMLNDAIIFGHSVANVDDLDDDGIIDLAVGDCCDNDGGPRRGAVWMLFMNTDGTVKAHQKISSTMGNFKGQIENSDDFGTGVTGLGDLNGDGIEDLAVGTNIDTANGPMIGIGKVWILFLGNSNNPPDCSNVIPEEKKPVSSFESDLDVTLSTLTPITNIKVSPFHKTVEIFLSGLTDIDGDSITLNIDGITQDEPIGGPGKDNSPDGFGVGTDSPIIRAERLGNGDGRVYEISFTANDGNGGVCSNSVFVGVPHNKNKESIDSGQIYDSTLSPINREKFSITVEDGEFIPGVGKTVTIRVFGADGFVNIEIFSPQHKIIEKLSFPASKGGKIIQPWVIPPGTEPGTYTFKATDDFNTSKTKHKII